MLATGIPSVPTDQQSIIMRFLYLLEVFSIISLAAAARVKVDLVGVNTSTPLNANQSMVPSVKVHVSNVYNSTNATVSFEQNATNVVGTVPFLLLLRALLIYVSLYSLAGADASGSATVCDARLRSSLSTVTSSAAATPVVAAVMTGASSGVSATASAIKKASVKASVIASG